MENQTKNVCFKYQEIDQASAHKAIVLVVATVASFGVGWLVDNLDGDAKLPEKHISFVDVIKSGDPMQIALKLIGVN